MTAHKHVAMITAKANNMELVVFCKDSPNDWFEYGRNGSYCPFYEEEEYFLCLPQHKEACLHWLNGGEVQIKSGTVGVKPKYALVNGFKESVWGKDIEIRIKPKKEKRWIVYRHDGEILGPFDSYKFAEGINSGQVIEIEVEHGR